MVTRLVRGPASVTELAGPLPMSLQAAMQHLAVLDSCGLVRSQKIGRVRTYRIETGPMREVESWFARQRTLWDDRLDTLGRELEGPNYETATPPPEPERPPP